MIISEVHYHFDINMDGSLQAAHVYDTLARLYADRFNDPADHINDFLEFIKAGGKILDVGCGHGINSSYIMSKGYKVIGIDLSSGMLELAKHKFPLIEFKLIDMRRLSFDPEYFDGIFMSFSLMHIPKIHVLFVLNLLNSLLKERGVIYISIQIGRSQEKTLASPLDRKQRIFVNIFTREEIKALLRKSGFSIARSFTRRPIVGEFNFSKYFVIGRKPSYQI